MPVDRLVHRQDHAGKVVSNLVAAGGLDKAGGRFRPHPDKGNKRLSWIAERLVYVVVLIPHGHRCPRCPGDPGFQAGTAMLARCGEPPLILSRLK